ncbi:hypothetical protein NE865_11672 [Phthorimaea operculella]|nr:hypothetical protein NE865_11672 [Phthorimaea operculella]
MSSCSRDRRRAERHDQGGDGALGWLTDLFITAFEYFWCSAGESLVKILYGFYRRLTWFNVIAFTLKYVPTGIYVYKTLKSVYTASRERINKIQMELDDLKLQIQIVDTKQCVREAEFLERQEELQRNAKQLRTVRARVRDLIATDEMLSRALRHATETVANGDLEGGDSANLLADEEDCNFIMMLLKQLRNGDNIPDSSSADMDKFELAEDKEQSFESSGTESRKDYRVKIIKVTNVYRVASLKHYIKQKRMRRANQQTVLKKKIDSIKQLLESWQKSLNAVLHNKSLQDPASIDMASQEAMGDYSKPNLREFSDSDSELKNSSTDMYYDEYNFNWSPNSYYNVDNNEREQPDIFESAEYHHKQSLNYPQLQDMMSPQDLMHSPMCDCGAGKGSVLFILPEETSSQVAIEEIN